MHEITTTPIISTITNKNQNQTRLTRRVPIVEQEQLTLRYHLSSPSDLSGVRATQSLALCVCFVDRCLSFCPFLVSILDLRL